MPWCFTELFINSRIYLSMSNETSQRQNSKIKIINKHSISELHMVVFIATLLVVKSFTIPNLRIREFLGEFNHLIQKCVFCAGYGKTIMSLSYRHIWLSLFQEMLFFFPWSNILKSLACFVCFLCIIMLLILCRPAIQRLLTENR